MNMYNMYNMGKMCGASVRWRGDFLGKLRSGRRAQMTGLTRTGLQSPPGHKENKDNEAK